MSYSFKSVSDALDSLCYSFDKLLNSGFYADVDKKSNVSLTPKHVYINWKRGDSTYTTVVWEDGTSTVVKRAEGDTPDHEKALMYAILKKAAGNNTSAVRRYLKSFDDVSNIISYKKERKNKGGYQE